MKNATAVDSVLAKWEWIEETKSILKEDIKYNPQTNESHRYYADE
jgi:hypothetical protein